MRSGGPGPLAPVPVVIDEAERAAFVARLGDGDPAGLARWLDEHGGLVPGGIGRGTRTRTVERHGTGSATVPLSAAEVRRTDRRMTVVVVVGVTADAAWSASGPGGALRSQAGRLDAGVPAVGAVTYRGDDRPARLRLRVLPGVTWGLAVVFSS